MDELYILRHGIAVEHGAPGIPDDDRPLTARGAKRVRRIAAGLAAIGVEPDRIITSPLPRARRTAEIAARALGLSGRLENADVLRAGLPAEAAADWLRSLPEAKLLIVGHNPMLDRIVSLLVLGDPEELPFTLKKGGVAALRTSARNAERFDIAWLAPPRLLRRMEAG